MCPKYSYEYLKNDRSYIWLEDFCTTQNFNSIIQILSGIIIFSLFNIYATKILLHRFFYQNSVHAFFTRNNWNTNKLTIVLVWKLCTRGIFPVLHCSVHWSFLNRQNNNRSKWNRIVNVYASDKAINEWRRLDIRKTMGSMEVILNAQESFFI